MSTSVNATTPAEDPAKTTFYDEIGGEVTITRLVDAFYDGVADDPILRPMYPQDDLGPANERLRLFFIQLFGGPSTYSERRGSPCLPSRHAPFEIDVAARDAWLKHMRAAMDSVELTEEQYGAMWKYMANVSDMLRNVAE